MERQFVNTNYLEVHSTPSVISPNTTKEIEIRFYPRELKRYSERIGFEVNGLSVVYIDILGQGAEMKVSTIPMTVFFLCLFVCFLFIY